MLNKFAKYLALVTTFHQAVLAVATESNELARENEGRQLLPPASQCPGELLCCTSVMYAGQPPASQVLSLLGIVVPPNDIVGLTCTPINGLWMFTNACSSQVPICCVSSAPFNYIVGIDCYPVQLGI